MDDHTAGLTTGVPPSEFGKAQFGGTSWFGGAQLGGGAGFGEAQFEGDARFGNAQFNGDVEFDGARFEFVDFDGARFVRGVPDAVAPFVSSPAEDGKATPRRNG